MRSARDRSGNVYSVDDLQSLHDRQQTIPPLVCDHPPCGCDVRFVSRHQQNRANRIDPIDVPAYIGLTSDSEHITGCRYDAPGRITAIVVAQSGSDFLKELDDGKRELRLLTLHNGLKGHSLSDATAPPGGKPSEGIPSGNTTTDYVQTEKRLTSYLRTTADLVVLRAMCECDAPLAAALTLRLGTKRIPWSLFFFERERYDEAWELVKAGGTTAYPIALAGVVNSHKPPAPGAKYTNNFLNCRPRYCQTDDPTRREVFEASIAHSDGNWLSTFPVGTEIVMFGIWKAFDTVERQGKDPRDPSRTITYITHKLALQPKFKRQVIEAA